MKLGVHVTVWTRVSLFRQFIYVLIQTYTKPVPLKYGKRHKMSADIHISQKSMDIRIFSQCAEQHVAAVTTRNQHANWLTGREATRSGLHVGPVA